MGISQFQYRQMLERTGKNDRQPQPLPEGATQKELPLHDDIIKHCLSQHPRWKYIHANPAARSTIAKGASDFTVFLPGGRTVCVECKSKTGKLSPDQLAWKLEMEMIGHTVHVVRSLDEFIEVCRIAMQ